MSIFERVKFDNVHHYKIRLLNRRKVTFAHPQLSIQIIGRDIPLTWETQIALSNVQHRYCALFVAVLVALFVALFGTLLVALNLCTFYLKFCCVSP